MSAQPVATGVLLGNTPALTEYRKAVIFQAASMDSLLPMEIELAECFVSHFLASFDFLDTAEHDCVYWLDLRVGQPPQRLAKTSIRTPAIPSSARRLRAARTQSSRSSGWRVRPGVVPPVLRGSMMAFAGVA